jgi:hypothetical protein
MSYFNVRFSEGLNSMSFHFYRYSRNFAIGIGLEHTFNDYYALRFGLGFWCFSVVIHSRR